MPTVAALAQSISTALAAARGREPARRVIDDARESERVPLHAIRHALATVLHDRNATRTFVWPTLTSVREALDEHDRSIDRALIASVSRDPIAALAVDLDACNGDDARATRSIEIVWKHIVPPASRAAALLIDMLRSHPLGPARRPVYRYLVSRGADVRGPLADDVELPVDDRMTVLAALAARHADQGRLRPTEFAPDPERALARMLADWTAYATHPRQLFHRYRRQRGFTTRERYVDALGAVLRWPLALEVRAHAERERTGEPQLLPARALAGGRFECGRCGEPRVAAIARHLVDERDPVLGVETEFACAACAMRYFTAWEIAQLDACTPLVPHGWEPS